MTDVKQNMHKTFEHFQEELKNLRSGRPNPSILDTVSVEVYGAAMKIRDLASVSVSERQLLVSPFDPTTANSIAKGIEKANLNLQPIVDGNIIRIPIPPMSEELRKEIVRDAKKKAEDAKVGIRENRRKANDQAKKDKASGEMTEDDLKRSEKDVQKLTDDYCKKIDDFFAQKEKDILQV